MSFVLVVMNVSLCIAVHSDTKQPVGNLVANWRHTGGEIGCVGQARGCSHLGKHCHHMSMYGEWLFRTERTLGYLRDL